MSALPVDDPFTTPDTRRSGSLFASGSRLDPSPRLDSSPNGLSLMTPPSPTQLKRTLIARLEDVQKRLQAAGQLGESLVRQQRELQEKIKEVEAEAAKGGEISPELREKLTALEKEYNEVHKESTRALLSSKIHGSLDSPHKHSSHGTSLQSLGSNSPTKLAVPSRRQRNQPGRSNDIEFATEIAQSLIMEVRKLQAMLQEREETIKSLNEEKANLEASVEYLDSRIRKLEESENKYREENWQLELVSQEKDATISQQTDNVTKLQSQIVVLEQEKSYYVREIDELRQTQAKVNEDNETVIRHHEGELSGLRRLLAAVEVDRDISKRTIDELKQELEEASKASLRLRHINEELQANQQNSHDPFQESLDEEKTPEGSPPVSPAKPTPRHGPLEAETLRSSLQHAHRLITKLKNDLTREKTEKTEVKRLLGEAKDKLDEKKKDGSVPPSARKSRKDTFSEIKYKKPAKPNLLGASRKPKSEITLLDQELDNADWEDELQLESPSPMSPGAPRTPLVRSYSESYESGFETAQEQGDSAFETATEKNYTTEPATPSQDYPTSADELTETEDTSGMAGKRSFYSGMGSFGKGLITPLSMNKNRDRGSIISIGSEDDDERPFRLGGYRTLDPDAFQPREEFSPATASQRLRLRIRSGGKGRLVNRIPSDGSMFGLKGKYVADSIESSPMQSIPPTASQSPVSSMRPRGSIGSVDMSRAGKSLFAELGGSFMEHDGDETEQDTPLRSGFGSPLRRMVDAGCNTEVPYPGTEQTVMIQATPPSKPSMAESWTQSTPKHRPTMSESWTQSTPVRRVTFAEFGTQATPPRKSESATQYTPKVTAALFDSATQFTPISYAESSVQSDIVPKPVMVPIGVQSDEPLKTLQVSTGIQFEGLPNLRKSTPFSPISRQAIMVDTPSPIKDEASVLSYSSTGVQPDDIQPDTSSVGIQHDELVKAVATNSTGVQSEETARPVMVSLGMQSEREGKPETSEIGIQSEVDHKPEVFEIGTQADEVPQKVTELISTGTQFDPELEKHETDEMIVIEPKTVKPEMADMGTQYHPELDAEIETDLVMVPLPDMLEGNVLKVDSFTQCDPVGVILPLVTAASSQTEPESQPANPPLSFSLVEIAKQEPIEVKESITFSNIVSQDTAPTGPDINLTSPPRALPPIPMVFPSTESGISSEEETPEGTPRKVSESIESSRERPITPTPQHGEKPPFFGSIFRRSEVEDAESEGVVQDKGKEVNRRPAMVDQGVQTAITYESTDRILKPVLVGKSLTTSPSYIPAHNSSTLHPPRTSSMQSSVPHDIGKGKGTMRMVESSPVPIKRPGSSNSSRSFTTPYPPLADDHRQAITAAQQKSTGIVEFSTLRGPPLLPASASKSNFRPRTPVNNGIVAHLPEESPASRGDSTPRPRHSQTTMRSEFVSPSSHRSSMSSFASELDEKFRINDENISQQQLQNDPRIIQAITQTMIGEYLWKYTRRATKSGLSTNRHRRFFWVHPYTRTLYWSEQDPCTAGKQELRAKSVSIESVRVITDDNPMPPGLHRKSLIVVTPGRDIQFTAPTGQRHETWYMALSYLLTRKMEEEGGEEVEETQDPAHQLDTPERYTGPRAASSLSSYNHRANRQTSPLRNASSLSHRRPPPTTNPNPGSMSRLTRVFKTGSYTSKSSRHPSISTAQALSMYEANEANDSMENVRLDQERRERDADQMENVRACCDGKHDVGTLSRSKGLKSLRSRRSPHDHHHHTHAHTQQAPQPQFARTYHSDNLSHHDEVD
ncbi:hypothetical protein EV426DRAFT_577225 [Tirmania nivea]|nr:hypothetical protein EV426DRAFT_577225 [Tirmania nivea]